MAWTAPATAVAGDTLTASLFNASIRDNLNATAVGVATTPGRIIVTTGLGGVAERIPEVAFNATTQGALLNTYTDLATPGPAVTVLTGGKALVSVGAHLSNSAAGQGARCAIAISGAHNEAAGDTNSLCVFVANANDGYQGSWVTIHNLAGGFNTFTMKYRCVGAGTANFSNRCVAVVPF